MHETTLRDTAQDHFAAEKPHTLSERSPTVTTAAPSEASMEATEPAESRTGSKDETKPPEELRCAEKVLTEESPKPPHIDGDNEFHMYGSQGSRDSKNSRNSRKGNGYGMFNLFSKTKDAAEPPEEFELPGCVPARESLISLPPLAMPKALDDVDDDDVPGPMPKMLDVDDEKPLEFGHTMSTMSKSSKASRKSGYNMLSRFKRVSICGVEPSSAAGNETGDGSTPLSPSGRRPSNASEYSMGGTRTAPPSMFKRMRTGSIFSSASKRKGSTGSMSSIHGWKFPNEILILFDWDDTLFPTSRIHPDRGCSNEEEEKEFRTLEATVVKLLRYANTLGHVVILTMAASTWVTQCRERVPIVSELIKELDIEVVVCRECLSKRVVRAAFSDDRDPSHYLKTRAMEKVIKKFYKNPSAMSRMTGGGSQRSWKNIISIGDSTAERWALQDLIFGRQQRSTRGDWKECRCKTMLLLGRPTMGQMNDELGLVMDSLGELVYFDGDMHVKLEAGDAENECVRLTSDDGSAFMPLPSEGSDR